MNLTIQSTFDAWYENQSKPLSPSLLTNVSFLVEAIRFFNVLSNTVSKNQQNNKTTTKQQQNNNKKHFI